MCSAIAVDERKDLKSGPKKDVVSDTKDIVLLIVIFSRHRVTEGARGVRARA